MLMRAPGWRRLLFDHLPLGGSDEGQQQQIFVHNNNNKNRKTSPKKAKVLHIRAPEELRREAVLEQLRFYYGIKKKRGLSKDNKANHFKITNFWYAQALVEVALFVSFFILLFLSTSFY